MKKPSPQMCHSEPQRGISCHSYCINRVRFLLAEFIQSQVEGFVEMTQKWNSRKRRAFSLIELLVSVGIFVVISGVLIANFRRGREEDALRNAAVTLVVNIQRMQSLALAGSSAEGNVSAFGVHFVEGADNYVLFGDRSTDGTLNYDLNEELIAGTIALPSGVIIDAVGSTSTTDVLFSLPRASVVISTPPIEASPSEARIKLKHENTTGTKTVTVNRVSGQVSIE